MDSALPNPVPDTNVGHPSACTKFENNAAAPLVGGRSVVRHAQALVAEFGEQAGDAAGMRAAHARAQDNPYTYCLWREVERAIAWISGPNLSQTQH